MNILDPNQNALLNRRDFLKKTTSFGMVGLLTPSFFKATDLLDMLHKDQAQPEKHLLTSFYSPLSPGASGEKALSFYNIHTGEFLKKCIFWVNGFFIPETQKEISLFFRDHRSNSSRPMDPNLLLLLHDLQTQLDTIQPLHLISGYRSAKTNAMLHKKSCGVAKNSRHITGQAADIHLPGRLKDIHAFAKKMKAGGVGRYAQFVHVDTGPIRYWGRV